MGHTTRPISEISIHALFAEGDLLQHVKQLLVGISIHALFAEGDLGAIAAKMEDDDFYPRPLRRGRPTTLSFWRTRHEFLSTPSSQRATRLCCARRQRRRHFYPRPLRRGRPRAHNKLIRRFLFLSTPSSQRATPIIRDMFHWYVHISIHALFAEGDSGEALRYASSQVISIHALFAEGDLVSGRTAHISPGISIHALFAEGDRAPARRSAPRRGISIHALFAEGDVASLLAPLAIVQYFYPRPLRRGRLGKAAVKDAQEQISIHALFAEGDIKYTPFCA